MLTPSALPYTAHPGFVRCFQPGQLTLGLVFPIEAYAGDAPTMQGQEALAQRAEAADFAALWVRDVPLRDPRFGDLGQIFDPWVYLGYIAAQTRRIALGTGAIVVPVRHPLHVAKAAASVDQLSGGRLLLGVASGDRPVEFPAFGVDADRRGELFREHIDILRQVQRTSYEPLRWSGGALANADLVPKPVTQELPLLITGSSQQALEWIAANGHGWLSYPRMLPLQRTVIAKWREAVRQHGGDIFKPFGQSLYIDLQAQPDAPMRPIDLGYRLGRDTLVGLLEQLRDMGVNHVMLNLKNSKRPAGEVLEELAQHVVPRFPAL